LRQERGGGFVGILFFPNLEVHFSRRREKVDFSSVSTALIDHRGRTVVEIVESDSRSPSEKRHVRSVRRIHEIRHVDGTSGTVVAYGKSRLGSCGIDSHEIRGDGNRIQFRLEIGQVGHHRIPIVLFQLVSRIHGQKSHVCGVPYRKDADRGEKRDSREDGSFVVGDVHGSGFMKTFQHDYTNF
jgi:hypothetical protein